MTRLLEMQKTSGPRKRPHLQQRRRQLPRSRAMIWLIFEVPTQQSCTRGSRGKHASVFGVLILLCAQRYRVTSADIQSSHGNVGGPGKQYPYAHAIVQLLSYPRSTLAYPCTLRRSVSTNSDGPVRPLSPAPRWQTRLPTNGAFCQQSPRS